jgi:hypothetical protein
MMSISHHPFVICQVTTEHGSTLRTKGSVNGQLPKREAKGTRHVARGTDPHVPQITTRGLENWPPSQLDSKSVFGNVIAGIF